ncbi:LMBR1-like conserved region-containing protein [Dictyostelium discoideum AX4]|uniref:LIMR family protein DDB_G0293610 n=1 Tax=Dictyostelium discoideum TaxID=44689 RepID=Y3610_DICDI|nr:LMBR1-like conserved region-containing protein [Dictyostelium discoideum AX4]Q54BI3.1 RecName: Full=LIMR family protein DDB_G0293610 [Dictyostelium discoideum]EAL60617.1 LMBR1-like conserved region-containing protein [Dictyostelium discoideum AX4]|eukprot:XP_629046.1 LMBR1-like conserved region-containing protein [Dictyostelium discoideum AX4]
MVNIFLIIVAVVIPALVALGSLYLIAYFQHPDDKNVAYFPKIIVILGITLAATSILMLPLDVANQGGKGGFPMDILWIVIYIVVAVFAIVICPFAMFFYESEEADPAAGSQIAGAFKGTFAILFAFAALTIVLYVFFGVAEIPTIVILSRFQIINYPIATDSINITTTLPEIASIVGGGNDKIKLDPGNPELLGNGSEYVEYRLDKEFLQFRVSIALFIITMVAFFGWLLFIIFGGIGLVALPFDMITDFKNRPQRIPYDKYLERKKKIGERATELVDVGKTIQSRTTGGIMSKRDRRNYNRFRQAIFLLEEDYERLKISYKRQGGKVILYYAQFFGGFIALGVSLGWLLHIIIYMITAPEPFHPFLNSLVISLNNAWGFLGVIVYGLLSFYLLFCVVKGNFKFGLRLFFLFPIHPMRVGNTMMNAFLFNVGLILITSVSITHFCTMAFSQFTSTTSINSLFETAVKNLKILKWFWVVYIFAIFAMSILTAIFLFIKPKDKPARIRV